MARAIERIEQELAAIEEAIALLRAEFHSTYSKYLHLLGQAVRRQLILASYQVCTHGYPEAFLSLPFSQRQTLQQSIQQLGKQIQEQLLSSLEPSNDSMDTDESDSTEPTAEPLPEQPEPLQDMTPEPSSESVESSESSDASAITETTNTLPTKAEQLAKWQEKVEKAIARTLQKLSLKTNRLLQENGILPGKLPAVVLEAAAKADASGEVTTGSPNLLNLLMETESEDNAEDSTLTRIIAINLRLSEIEFADPALSASRHQIRHLSAKGNTLYRQYQKKQRERSVAQAEAAWRASWYED
ncbi:MAG TPA: hypothetical protein V6D11_01200 [Waterburya sp.]|jgi:hypothetical protein